MDTQASLQGPGRARLLADSFPNPPPFQFAQDSLDASNMYGPLPQYTTTSSQPVRPRIQEAAERAAVDSLPHPELWGGKLSGADTSTPRRPELAEYSHR